MKKCDKLTMKHPPSPDATKNQKKKLIIQVMAPKLKIIKSLIDQP